MAAAPQVSIVIPARDAGSTLARTLAAISAQAGPSYEVIVADDGSSDRTVEIAEAAGARVVAAPGTGPGGARNAAATVALADQLAFLDADCFPEPGWLEAGARALGRADLVQGRVEPEPGGHGSAFDRSVSVLGASPLFEAANMFVRRSLFERIGGFEDWLGAESGKALGEDTLLGWEAARAGARIEFEPRCRVQHAVIPRGALGFALERRRLRYFPALVRRIPELRHSLCQGRLFLNWRSAGFDLAVLSALAAVVGRRPRILLGTAPYLLMVARRATRFGRHAPRVAAAEVAADAIGCVSLAEGSVRHRSILL